MQSLKNCETVYQICGKSEEEKKFEVAASIALALLTSVSGARFQMFLHDFYIVFNMTDTNLKSCWVSPTKTRESCGVTGPIVSLGGRRGRGWAELRDCQKGVGQFRW